MQDAFLGTDKGGYSQQHGHHAGYFSWNGQNGIHTLARTACRILFLVTWLAVYISTDTMQSTFLSTDMAEYLHQHEHQDTFLRSNMAKYFISTDSMQDTFLSTAGQLQQHRHLEDISHSTDTRDILHDNFNGSGNLSTFLLPEKSRDIFQNHLCCSWTTLSAFMLLKDGGNE